MYAGPGDDNGPYKGGKGGTSRIQFTMKKKRKNTLSLDYFPQ